VATLVWDANGVAHQVPVDRSAEGCAFHPGKYRVGREACRRL